MAPGAAEDAEDGACETIGISEIFSRDFNIDTRSAVSSKVKEQMESTIELSFGFLDPPVVGAGTFSSVE